MCALRTVCRFGFALIACAVLSFAARAQTNLPSADEPRATLADVVIHVNQVAYDGAAPKFAVIESAFELPKDGDFVVKDAATGSVVFTSKFPDAQECSDWFPGRYFYHVDFSAFRES